MYDGERLSIYYYKYMAVGWTRAHDRGLQRAMTGTAPAVGVFVELEFPPPNGQGWERGVVRSVTQDARCSYVAYVGYGEDIKVYVKWSS